MVGCGVPLVPQLTGRGDAYPFMHMPALRPACHCKPTQDIKVAGAFSVTQVGSDGSKKVRRCEDYRRSFHNSTIAVEVPAHDTIHTYIGVLQRLHAQGVPTEVWCQDLWAAYRQFPVREPNEAFTLLATPNGPMLFCHSVLPFGAASSVWCFNRCVDALGFLARPLLLILLIHYVDDVGGPDAAFSSKSSFWAFQELCDILGMRLKPPSKAQPPATRHKLLGVILEILPDGVLLSPSPDRVAKVTKALHEALLTDSLEPEVAQKLTGKLNFLQTTLFGQVGSAALRPLYSRGHEMQQKAKCSLNGALRCSIKFLIRLLGDCKPKWFPFASDAIGHSVVYADAFFQLGDSKFGLSDEPPAAWHSRSSCMYRNGWGFVVRTSAGVRFGSGSVPPEVLSFFASRKAYIYVLEIIAQIVAAITSHSVLSPYWLGFCDNTAGKAALAKGWGSEPAVNNLLACFWSLSLHKGWQPHFEWVPSEQNISDPFSRGDTSIGQTRGWSELQRDMRPLWRIFLRLAADFDYAVGEAAQDLLSLSWRFS